MFSVQGKLGEAEWHTLCVMLTAASCCLFHSTYAHMSCCLELCSHEKHERQVTNAIHTVIKFKAFVMKYEFLGSTRKF